VTTASNERINQDQSGMLSICGSLFATELDMFPANKAVGQPHPLPSIRFEALNAGVYLKLLLRLTLYFLQLGVFGLCFGRGFAGGRREDRSGCFAAVLLGDLGLDGFERHRTSFGNFIKYFWNTPQGCMATLDCTAHGRGRGRVAQPRQNRVPYSSPIESATYRPETAHRVPANVPLIGDRHDVWLCSQALQGSINACASRLRHNMMLNC
jgi:hypothetical protein